MFTKFFSRIQCSIVLVAICATTLVAQTPKREPGAELTPEQKKQAELAKMRADIISLQDQGAWPDAKELAVKLVQAAEEVTGRESATVAEHLTLLAEIETRLEAWDDVLSTRKKALNLRKKLHGEKDWRTQDATRALELTEFVRKLSADDRKTLFQADDDFRASERASLAKKPLEGLKPAKAALDARLKVLGKDHLLVAEAYLQYSIVRNDPKISVESNQIALAIREKVLGETHPDTGRSRFNLGMTLINTGEVNPGLKLLKQAVAAWQTTEGVDPRILDHGLSQLALECEDRDPKTEEKSSRELIEHRKKWLGNDHIKVAEACHRMGLVKLSQGEYAKAKVWIEEALDICRKNNNPNAIATTLNSLGIANRNLRDLESAKKCYLESYTLRKKNLPARHPNIGQSAYNLATVYDDLSEHKECKKYALEAYEIWQTAYPPTDTRLGNCLAALGNAQNAIGEFEDAKKSFTQALAIFQKAYPDRHLRIADAYIGLGTANSELREDMQAKKNLSEANTRFRLALPEAANGLVVGLNALAHVHISLHELEEGKKCAQEAVNVARKYLPEDAADVASSLSTLGAVQGQLHEHENAKKNFSEAVAVLRKAKKHDQTKLIPLLHNLGRTQLQLQEMIPAWHSLTEALNFSTQVHGENHIDTALLRLSIGNLEMSRLDNAAAEKQITAAIAIYRKIYPKDHPSIASALYELSRCQLRQHRYDQAKASLKEALDSFRKHASSQEPAIGQVLESLSLLDLLSGTTTPATLERLKEAVEFRRDELGRIAPIQAEAEQLVSSSSGRSDILYLCAALETHADAKAAYDQLAAFKGSVTAQQRWSSIIRETADPETTKLMQDLRAIDLELLALSLSGPQSPTRDKAIPANRAEVVQEKRKELERQLMSRSQAYKQMTAKAKILGRDISSTLPEGSVLIDIREYTHFSPPKKGSDFPESEDRLAAFIVRPGTQGVSLIPLGNAARFSALLGTWRASYAIGKLPPKGQPDPAFELRKLLWEPLVKHLPQDTKTILISPDSSLAGLPFAALPGSDPDTYLLEQFTFVTVPVPALLPELFAQNPLTDGTALLAAGNIDFGEIDKQGGFRQLANTGLEVDILKDRFARAFPKGNSHVLKSSEATKAEFIARAPASTYVHLATHGYFAEDALTSAQNQRDLGDSNLLRFDQRVARTSPDLLSGVVFAGVNNADPAKRATGLLTAREVAQLNLSKTELVVLSACDTGLGKITATEGVLGLQRAFQVAGAKRVISTLWSVDDAATRKVMERFYDNLWVKKLPAAAALREAQLWAVRGGIDGLKPGEEQRGVVPPGEKVQTTDHRHPYYWAAFTLSGDSR